MKKILADGNWQGWDRTLCGRLTSVPFCGEDRAPAPSLLVIRIVSYPRQFAKGWGVMAPASGMLTHRLMRGVRSETLHAPLIIEDQ
jgi:hypothetical protein